MAAGDEKLRVTIEVDTEGLRVLDQGGKVVKQFATDAAKAGLSVEELADSFNEGLVAGVIKAAAETEKLSAKLKDEQRLLQAEIELRKQVNQGVLSEIDASAKLARARANGNETIADLLEGNTRLKAELDSVKKATGDVAAETDRLTKVGNENAGMWQKLKAGASSVTSTFSSAFTVIGGAREIFGVLSSLGETAFSGLNDAARTFRESVIHGVGTEFLSELTAVAEAAGRDIDDVLDLVRDVRERVGEATTAFAEGDFTNIYAQAFQRLGAGPALLQKFATDTEAAVEFIIGKLEEAQRDPRIQFSLQELSNQGFEKFGPIVAALGEQGLEQAREKIRALGLSIDEETAQLAQKAQTNLGLLSQAFDGVVRQLTAGAAPAIEALSRELLNLVASFGIGAGGFKEVGESIADAVLVGTGKALIALADFLDEVNRVGIGGALYGIFEGAFEGVVALASIAGKRMVAALFSSLDARPGQSFVADLTDAFGLNPLRNAARQLSAEADKLQAEFNETGQAALQGNEGVKAAADGARAAGKNFVEVAGAAGATNDQLNKAGTSGGKAAGGYDASSRAAGEAAVALANFNKELTRQGDALTATQAILQQAAKGSITLAQAEQQAAVATAALSRGITDQAAQQRLLTLERQKAAIETLKAVAAAGEQLDAEEEKLDVLRAVVEAGGDAEDAARAVAEADIARAAAAAIARGADEADAEALKAKQLALLDVIEAQRVKDELARGNGDLERLREELGIHKQRAAGILSAAEAERQLAVAAAGTKDELRQQAGEKFDLTRQIEETEEGYIRLGSTIKDSLSQVFDALVAGTLDLGDSLQSLGLAIGKRFFDSMIDSKLKHFDPAVKSNFLELGSFGESVFGTIFDGVGRLFSGIGGGGGNFVGPLLENGSTGTTGFLGGGGSALGLLASFIGGGGGAALGGALGSDALSIGSSAFSLANTGVALLTNGFQAGGGIISALFGSGAAQATVGSLLGTTGSGLVTNLFGTAGASALSTSLGTLGTVAGGVGSVVGGGYSAFNLAQGDFSAANILGLVAATASAINFLPVVGQIIYAIAVIGAAIAGLVTDITPTKGTLQRRIGESILDQTDTFSGLQDVYGDLTRKKNNLGANPALPEQREKVGTEGLQDITGFAAIFAEAAFGDTENGTFVAQMAFQWTNILTDFFSRMEGSSEEVSQAIRGNLLSAFKDLGITDASKAFEQLNDAAAHFIFPPGNFDYLEEQVDSAGLLGAAIRGVGSIFESELPAGVHIAALALESMKNEGNTAFTDLDTVGHETLLNLSQDAESFDAVVAKLFRDGFKIDTEEFKTRLADITASAQFVGENIGQVFQFENVGVGIEAVFQNLKGQVLGLFQETSLKQLFETTNIAASFEPVFAALNRIEEFDLTTATGSKGFMDLLLPALAQGKVNLQDYIPILQLMADNWKEIERTIEEALEPDVFEKAGIAAEAAFSNLGGVLNEAITAGITVLENGGTWDRAVSVFNQTFGSGIESSIREAVFKAIADQAFIQPLVATYQPAFAYVISAGMTHGFNDPRVKQALALLMGALKSDAEELGLAIFSARVDSEGITSDIEKSFNDAADITVGWANDVRSALGGAMDAAFEALQSGGSRDEAIAAWNEALGDGTYNSVLDAIARAMIEASLLEPFIQKHAPAMQYIAAAALEHGVDDPRVQDALQKQFGPGSQFQADLANLGPFSIDLYGTIVLPDGTKVGPTAGSGGGAATSDGTTVVGLPGAAKGGAFGPGSTFIVGEEGPEVVVYGEDGSMRVIPIDRATMRGLLDGGAPGYASGITIGGSGPGDTAPRPGPRDNPGTYYPAGFRPIGGGRPGTGAPITSPLDPRHPDYVDPRDKPGTGETTISVSFNFDSAMDAFFAGGTEEELHDAIMKAAGEGLVAGMKQGLIAQIGLEEFQKKVAQAIERGASEAELIAMGKEFAATAEDAITKASPAFKAVAEEFGLNVKEEVESVALDPVNMLLAAAALGEELRTQIGESPKEIGEALIAAAQKAAPAVGQIVGGSLKGLLSDPKNLNFETFSQNLRGQIFQNVAGGLIDAFVQSAVIQGALAPMLGAISVIFDQIGKKQLTVAEANGLIAQQIGLISGVLDDPAFKATIETLIGGISDIGKNLNAFPPAAAEVRDSAVEVQDAVTEAQKDVCSGQCELQKEVIEYGASAISAAGRQGDITDTVYRPKAFARGGVVTRPTLGLVGEVEPEIIIPVSALRDFANADLDRSVIDQLTAARDAFGVGKVVGGDATALRESLLSFGGGQGGDVLGDLRTMIRSVAVQEAAPTSGAIGGPIIGTSRSSSEEDLLRTLVAEVQGLRRENAVLAKAIEERPVHVEARVGEDKVIDVMARAHRTARQAGINIVD